MPVSASSIPALVTHAAGVALLQVILGVPYGYGLDLWSVGCTLYELYTGAVGMGFGSWGWFFFFFFGGGGGGVNSTNMRDFLFDTTMSVCR
jgi:serine/threonine protein kinase